MSVGDLPVGGDSTEDSPDAGGVVNKEAEIMVGVFVCNDRPGMKSG